MYRQYCITDKDAYTNASKWFVLDLIGDQDLDFAQYNSRGKSIFIWINEVIQLWKKDAKYDKKLINRTKLQQIKPVPDCRTIIWLKS